MSKRKKYFQELKNRKVINTAGLYAVSSFIIMQVAAIIQPVLMLPDWTTRLILILLVLGFPIAMIFAWIYDRTPDGFVKTDSINSEDGSIPKDGLPKDENGKSAIVFVDIEGYTKLMNQDEKKAIDLIHYKNKIILPFINKYGGIHRRVGHGTICIFPDSAKAACFSLEIIKFWEQISPTKLKIGIHLDKIVLEQGDVLGKGINFACKINELATSCGICISKTIANEIENRPDIHATSMGDKKLEGFEETHELFSLNIPDKFIPLDADITSSENNPIIENKFRWGSLVGWAAGILLIIFIVFSSIPYFGQSNENTTIKIAVFPFENIIKNKDFDWLSDGVARTLTFQLSKLNTLKVIDQLQILKTIETVQPKEASMAYDIVARKTAEKMDINLLLSGSYQIYGKKVQIIAQLIEVESGIVESLMMETYSLDSLLFMQHDVANKITILLNNKSGN